MNYLTLMSVLPFMTYFIITPAQLFDLTDMTVKIMYPLTNTHLVEAVINLQQWGRQIRRV